MFVVALALIAATYALINHTKLGKAMRATFQDRDTAALMGVQIGSIHTATFALGSGLAAAAGALLGPVFVAYPTMGDLAAAKAFAIVILGGLGSIPGATVGGFILALGGGTRRRLRLLGLSRCDGIPAHHPDPDLQADGPVRAEGAHRVKQGSHRAVARCSCSRCRCGWTTSTCCTC